MAVLEPMLWHGRKEYYTRPCDYGTEIGRHMHFIEFPSRLDVVLYTLRYKNMLREPGGRQLMARVKICCTAIPNPASGQSMLIHYRSLQILNMEFNLCFSEVFLPLLQFGIIFSPATTTFILILLHSQLDGLTLTVTSFASIVPLILVFLFYPSGVSCGTYSVNFLKSFTLTSNRWKREKNSCRPLKVELGSMMIFGRAMVLKTLHLIFIWTARYTLLNSKYTQ